MSAVPFLAFSVVGCASTGRLGEFDFRGAGLAVVTVAPPHPQVFADDFYDPEGRGWLETLFRIGSEVARDSQADRAREKLAEASGQVDVVGLMGDRILERASRLLRARPMDSAMDADFELEVRVKEYGIRSDSWDSQVDFFIKAEVLFLESESGSRIWKRDVEATDPVNPNDWAVEGSWANLITAGALARLSVEEIRVAFEGLAVYSADRVVDELQEALDRVHR
jgi:hypothetical protein